ncbi:hypothetical protein [Pantoea vagans]|uniref:hypothetical protein n=1 Tax=Pantoea vagans TaxID=470934 RepID=UPI003FA39D8E
MDALLVRKSALTCGFSEEGKLVAPVEFLVTGYLFSVHIDFSRLCPPGSHDGIEPGLIAT